MTSKSLRNVLKEKIQRYTFHRRIPSLVIASYMYITNTPERVENVRKQLKNFNLSVLAPDKKAERKLLFDLFYSRAYYAINYHEYFLYGLNRSKDASKKEYVGWLELYHYYIKLLKMGHPEFFAKKDKTYCMFRDFYHRELISVYSKDDQAAFLSFFDRHQAGIIKPAGSYGGKNIEILKRSDAIGPEQMWEKVKDRIPFVVEELIEQAPEMSAFYPNSVNTIRYNTFYHEGKLTKLQAALRMGRGGSVVDNASAGGIYTLVDPDTGRILCPARSDANELFENHPDTGAHFEGEYIPRWDELNAIVEKVVQVVPDQKLVGWDFAFSKDGWVLVEGNTTPGLQSFDLDHGMRPLVEKTFGQVVPLWK